MYFSAQGCARPACKMQALRLFSYYVRWVLIGSQAQQSWVAQFAVASPLNEADLHDDLWLHPVGAQTRQANGFGERWFRYFDLIELGAEIEEHFRVEAGADLAGEDEIGWRGLGRG